MARFTQYVGLSKEALDYLAKHKHKKMGQWKMTTGIAGEDVMGDIFEVEEGKNGYPTRTLAEVEDVTPWSGGPIIHTALRDLSTGEKYFKWKDEDIHYD